MKYSSGMYDVSVAYQDIAAAESEQLPVTQYLSEGETIPDTPMLVQSISRIKDLTDYDKPSSKVFSADDDLLDLIKTTLKEHNGIMKSIHGSIIQNIELNQRRLYNCSLAVEDMMDAVAQGILNSFLLRDYSLADRLVSAITTELKEEDHDQSSIKNLNDLFSDFVEQASRVGELIISESHKPIASKMVRPSKIGGIAGGEKFIARYIFYCSHVALMMMLLAQFC
jgi:hypothetical protein